MWRLLETIALWVVVIVGVTLILTASLYLIFLAVVVLT